MSNVNMGHVLSWRSFKHYSQTNLYIIWHAMGQLMTQTNTFIEKYITFTCSSINFHGIWKVNNVLLRIVCILLHGPGCGFDDL